MKLRTLHGIPNLSYDTPVGFFYYIPDYSKEEDITFETRDILFLEDRDDPESMAVNTYEIPIEEYELNLCIPGTDRMYYLKDIIKYYTEALGIREFDINTDKMYIFYQGITYDLVEIMKQLQPG